MRPRGAGKAFDMTTISDIQVSQGNVITASVNGEEQAIDPTYLLMQVLAQKRSLLTKQYVGFISDMNAVNQKAEKLEQFRARISAKVAQMKDGDKINSYTFDTTLRGDMTTGEYDYQSSMSGGNYTKAALQDLAESVRNKIQSMNNINSQTQVKIKMVQEYRDETIEWQSSLQDQLLRVFNKINQ